MNHINRRDSEIVATATVYSDVIEVKSTPSIPRRGGGIRKSVTAYTSNSQRRHRRTLGKLRGILDAMFVTLTYPNAFPANPVIWKQHHEALFKRIQRWFGPQIGESWRLETRRRKSGTRIAEFAPHFHSLLFKVCRDAPRDRNKSFRQRQIYQDFLCDAEFVQKAVQYDQLYEQHVGHSTKLKWRTNWLDAFRIWVAWSWYEIVGSGDIKHLFAGTQVRSIESNKNAAICIRRYMTKSSPDASDVFLFALLILIFGKSSIFGPLILGLAKQPPSGRFWGTRGNMDLTSSLEIQLTHEQYVQLRRLIIRFLKGRGPSAFKFSTWLRRYDVRGRPLSFHVLSLGDSSKSEWSQRKQSTVFHMLLHVGAVSRL
jgi:hypothetical protein